MGHPREWLYRMVALWVAVLVSGSLLGASHSALAAGPTTVPAPLRLAQTGVDAAQGEIWAVVTNVGPRPVAAGVEWRLWANAAVYGKTVIASGELPALDPEGTYLLTVSAPRPDGVYRLQLLFRAAHGFSGSLWSDEIALAVVAELTPTSAPAAEPAVALVALPAVSAPEAVQAPTTAAPPATSTAPAPTAAPEEMAVPTAELHTVLIPLVSQPPPTFVPVAQPSETPPAPGQVTQLAVGALAVLLVVAAVAVVRRIAQNEPGSTPPSAKS
jgi:hypothetical protein